MTTTRIDADLLIPGAGAPIENGSVVFEGGYITYAGASAAAPGSANQLVPVLMPGMWETHAHFMGIKQANIEKLATMAPQLGVVRSAQELRLALDAGFTSVREVGGYGTYLAALVEEGTLTGPDIYASGSILSQTGGHVDIHGFAPPVVDDIFERHFGAPSVADGPDDCRRLVRRQLRLGARVIKVCASGGVMSQVDHPLHQQFSVEELQAIVDEAARAERVVAAHCHGKPGIMAAIEAGVKTIEHGSYLDQEAAEAMIEADALLVPTRFVVDELVNTGVARGMPQYAIEKINAIADRHFEAMQIGVAAGVRFALGTDMFVLGTWGRNGEELGHLVAAGLTPLQAIEAATANGPLTLGLQAPASGRLEPGCVADVIAVAANPLEDIGVLADPANITGVWKAGNPVK